jgi:N-acyl homoserine lactone hydrolase
MTSLRIHPLHVGTMNRQITNFCHTLEPQTIELPLIIWYIEGADKRILVDTGGGDPTPVHPKMKPYARNQDQTIENALRKIGLTCDDIEIVIVSHLHWDHSAGNGLFKNAELIVQKEELKMAINPLPITAWTYFRDVVENVKYSVISGDKEIAKGVQVILTPGHTYGLQGVLVQGEKRKLFISSDTLPLFKNIQQKPYSASATYVDLKSYYATMKKIEDLSAFIIPSHDFGVFEKEVYY